MLEDGVEALKGLGGAVNVLRVLKMLAVGLELLLALEAEEWLLVFVLSPQVLPYCSHIPQDAAETGAVSQRVLLDEGAGEEAFDLGFWVRRDQSVCIPPSVVGTTRSVVCRPPSSLARPVRLRGSPQGLD